MSRGITLLCIGNPHYGYFAANMAMSIKAVSPDIPIQLVYEPHSISYLGDDYLRFFDHFTRVEKEDILIGPKLSPAKAKLSLFKYSLFNETIYFDIDGLAIKDINPLFDELKGLDYSTQIHGRAPINEVVMEGDLTKGIQWCPLDIIREYYPFPEGAILPATNTSFFYFTKSEFANKFFTQALDNLSSPIPIPKIKTWGGGQPDELYVSITLAQLGYIPEKPAYPPVYLRGRKAHGETHSLEDLQSRHYVIGIFGDTNYNHRSQIDYYRRINKANSIKMLGRSEEFKLEKMMQHKWVLNKR